MVSSIFTCTQRYIALILWIGARSETDESFSAVASEAATDAALELAQTTSLMHTMSRFHRALEENVGHHKARKRMSEHGYRQESAAHHDFDDRKADHASASARRNISVLEQAVEQLQTHRKQRRHSESSHDVGMGSSSILSQPKTGDASEDSSDSETNSDIDFLTPHKADISKCDLKAGSSKIIDTDAMMAAMAGCVKELQLESKDAKDAHGRSTRANQAYVDKLQEVFAVLDKIGQLRRLNTAFRHDTERVRGVLLEKAKRIGPQIQALAGKSSKTTLGEVTGLKSDSGDDPELVVPSLD